MAWGRRAGGSKKGGWPVLAAAVFLVLAAAGAWLALSGGGPAILGPSRRVPAVVLDEAFALSRPGLAAALERLSAAPLSKPRSTVTALAAGPAALLEAAAANGFVPAGQALPPGATRAAGLIASPLLAQAVAQAALQAGSGTEAGLEALGGAVIATPEWQGPLPHGLVTAVTDRLPAYRAAGRALGTWMAALDAEAAKSAGGSHGSKGASPAPGGKAVAALLFRSGPSRPADCVEAFVEGYREAGRGDPLVETLGEPGEGDAGLEAGLGRLLSTDLRAVLIAIGPGSREAASRLSRPAIAVGLDSTEGADLEGLAFGVLPDNRAIAKTLERLARGGGTETVMVPARLVRQKGAEDFGEGQSSLASVLAKAGAFHFRADGP